MKKGEPYTFKSVINNVCRESIPQNSYSQNDRKRTKSFQGIISRNVKNRAEKEGITIDIEEDKQDMPTICDKAPTVLPGAGPKRTKHGISKPTGIFAIVHDMQELDDNAFLLLYLEATREYESRTQDKGWTNHVMEHVMERQLENNSDAQCEEYISQENLEVPCFT